MTDDDRDVIQRMIDAWNSGGVDSFLEYVAPDCTMVTDPSWPDGGTMSNREEIERFTQDFAGYWETLRLRDPEPERVGKRWVFRTAWEGRALQSDVEVSVPFTVVASIEGDLMTEMELYFDHDEAIRAAGP
jgi:ketosteroid isomerase-like protein